MRDVSPSYASVGIDDLHRDSLKRIVVGLASDGEIQNSLGAVLDVYRSRGPRCLELGSPEWRAAARQLAGVELEVLRRMYEREEGAPDGEPVHPLLTARDLRPAAPSAKLLAS